MRSVFTLVALPLLLLFILDGSLPPLLPAISVKAFPAAATTVASPAINNITTFSDSTIKQANDTVAGEVTEYPVFISVTEEIQTSPETEEPEVVTETYMIVEDQEVDDYDNDSNSSTVSPTIVRSTTPMQSPKSSPEQEEVLRELKKLWDLSEGMSDTENDALKNSLSSIVHLAYARVYIEPDETLLKLKTLLQQLQERILQGTSSNVDDESHSTTEKTLASSLSPITKVPVKLNHAISTSSPILMTATAGSSNIGETKVGSRTRIKRSFYDGYDDEVEAIFFANVNSEENSVLPEDKDQYQLKQSQTHGIEQVKTRPSFTTGNNDNPFLQAKNDTEANIKDPITVDRTLLSVESLYSPSTMSMSTSTPSSTVQKIIHINDRQKPMTSFYLTPERIKELKSRVTSSTTTTTSTLSPISIVIEDELENEVNLLQQQQQIDNYDIHISSSQTLAPLTTATPPNSFFHKKPFKGQNTIVLSPSTTTTESPFTAEDIALALFQLLRPDTFEDDESDDENVTTLPHPKPSSILYQVGSLSSVLNFTINAKNASTSTTVPTTALPSKIITTSKPLSSTTIASAKLNTTLSFLHLKEKYLTKIKNNATLLVRPPTALADLGFTSSTTIASTSTERKSPSQNNDVYDYTDVLDQKPSADQSSMATTIVHGTQEGFQQMVDSLQRLSVGAKMVLLFSVSISVLSIGFGIYALGPPLAGVGVLGIVIPIGLLLLFETSASSGKRKLTTRQREQLLIDKLQSEEFSKIMDMLFEAVIKYSKG